jgi:Rrf2 family protein
MLELGLRADEDTPVSMSVVAKRAAISKPYLDQLAMALRHASLIRGRAGRHGGYVLARPPETILLREIVEAVIGEVNVTECVTSPDVCARSEFCSCRKVWQQINTRIRAVLDDYTLADLTAHEREHARRSRTEPGLVSDLRPPEARTPRAAT